MKQDNEEPKPLTPYLVIPYFDGDQGARPLPPSQPSWLCSAIHVNGLPYTGAPLTPRVPVQLSLVLANLGDLDTMAIVNLFWTNPATAISPANLHLIGQVMFSIGSTSIPAQPAIQESPTMEWTPDETFPEHFCLIAQATCVLDPAPVTFDIVHDRHFGQQNVNLLLAKPGQRFAFEFYAGNPGRKEGSFTIQVRALERGTLKQLESYYRARAVELASSSQHIRIVEPVFFRLARREVTFELKPEEHRLCQIVLDIPTNLAPHEFFAVEVVQTSKEGADHSTMMSIGAIGVLVFASP